jgi:hypothetical protein
LKKQTKYLEENPYISSLDKPSSVTEFFIHELEFNYEKVSIRFGLDPQELLDKGPRLNQAWSLLALCQCRNKTGIHAPATDGGPGNYGHQRMRAEEISFWAPATDGGPGNRGHQGQREKYKNKNYTNDALNRDMRGSTKCVGGVKVKCAYLSNGQACMKDCQRRLNGLYYWCCQVHINCFNHWPESQRNEYN